MYLTDCIRYVTLLLFVTRSGARDSFVPPFKCTSASCLLFLRWHAILQPACEEWVPFQRILRARSAAHSSILKRPSLRAQDPAAALAVTGAQVFNEASMKRVGYQEEGMPQFEPQGKLSMAGKGHLTDLLDVLLGSRESTVIPEANIHRHVA